MRTWTLGLLLVLAGCVTEPGDKPGDDVTTPDTPDIVEPSEEDGDADGFAASVDCDDTDPTVHPDATEACDGLDNDCDGTVDGPDAVDALTWFEDHDADGFGIEGTVAVGCDQPEGYATRAGDCDDVNDRIHPDANEVCNGEDDDCTGEIDDAVGDNWYYDGDADGWGDADITEKRCDGDSLWVADGTDCDDANDVVYPTADEICDAVDNNCDSLVDDADPLVVPTTMWFEDIDGDGYGREGGALAACVMPFGYVPDGGDCNEADTEISPGADETCADGIDNNCDGHVDDPSSVDAITWYADADGDGSGDATANGVASCRPLVGFADNAADCDDANADVAQATPWYPDLDGDGLGDMSADPVTTGCDGAAQAVLDASDCDDDDAGIHGSTPWYSDDDGDGFGTEASVVWSCDAVAGYSPTAGDCDDVDGAIFPGMTWFVDNDGDGDGTADSGVVTGDCTSPGEGWAMFGADCDDSNPGAHQWTGWFHDADGDGFGSGAATHGCFSPAPDWTLASGDCNDANPALSPATFWFADADGDGFGGQTFWTDGHGASTRCIEPNDKDTIWVLSSNDCDDANDAISPATVWFGDSDGDGEGDPATTSSPSCDQPVGFVFNSLDCDATSADMNSTTPWFEDADGDGYGDKTSGAVGCVAPGDGWVPLDGDCDDADPTRSPETPWYADGDGDGFGDFASVTQSCFQPAGHVPEHSDCDDSDVDVNGPTVWYGDADHDGLGDINSVAMGCAPEADQVGNADDCDDGDIEITLGDFWFVDSDEDGLGDGGVASVRSCLPIAGHVLTSNDCDDADSDVSGPRTWYLDADGDGFGSEFGPTLADCEPITGFAGNIDDCNDEDEDIGAPTAWFFDGDGDGFGNATLSVDACAAPVSYVADATDCADDNGAVGAPSRWHADTDGDGFGNAAVFSDACTSPADHVVDATDCDDDDFGTTDGDDYYPDLDGDSLGDPAGSPVRSCTPVAAASTDSSDCDDLDLEVGGPVVWYMDADGDGFGDLALPSDDACTPPASHVAASTDCDDSTIAAKPGGLEICDGIDNDCDDDIDPASAWWDGDWRHRITATINAASFGIDGAPISLPVDTPVEFDGAEIRVVLQDCGGLGVVELPSQFWSGNNDPITGNPTPGAAVFLYDTDGDLGTIESFAADSSVEVAVYFGNSGAAAPSYTSPLTVDEITNTISTGATTVSFDAAAGGVMSFIGVEGGPIMARQTSAGGNGIFTSGAWSSVDAATPSTFEVTVGDVFAAVETSGTMAAGFDYTYTYFAFAGRPEILAHVSFTATTDVDIFQNPNAIRGIRPFQIESDYFNGNGGTKTNDAGWQWMDQSDGDGTYGYAMGYAKAPLFSNWGSNSNRYMLLTGNEVIDTVGATNTETVFADEVFVDTVVVAWPHTGTWAAVESEFQATLEGWSSVQGEVESLD